MTGKKLCNAWGLLALSALLLAAAFWWPAWLHWSVFVFAIPLFYCALIANLSCVHGFFWGIIFFSLHWWGLFVLVHERGQGSWRYAAPALLIVYCAFYAGIWFAGARYCSRRFSSPVGTCASWVACATLYFFILEKGIFWIFSSLNGYCFAMPLLPLAVHAQWLQMISFFYPFGLVVLLLSAQAALAYYLPYKKKGALGLASLCLLPFAVGWLIIDHDTVPSYVTECIYVPPPTKREHPIDCAQAIDEAIERAVARKPNARFLFMPESAYPFPINEHNEAVNMWCLTMGDDRYLIVGTHWQHNGCEGPTINNCVCCVNDSRIIDRYVKTQLFWFTEYVPFPWSHCSFTRNLFLKNKQGFSSTSKWGLSAQSPPGFPYRFAICSELFFNAYLKGAGPLIAAVHDAWFSARYMRNLMFLYARFAAMAKRQEIIYVGHEKGVWMGPKGGLIEL